MRDNFGREYGKFSHILGTFVLIEKHFFRFLNSLIKFLGIVTYQQYIGLEFCHINICIKKLFILTFSGFALSFKCKKVTTDQKSVPMREYYIRQFFLLKILIYSWYMNIIQEKIRSVHVFTPPATLGKQRNNFVSRDNFGPYCM